MADAFRDYQSDPTSETLVRLLRDQQDRVYRLCFQVLRHDHDAEDAAQGVLLKIVDEARTFDEPEAFRRWVTRVSLNAALETARKAARRRAHETRAAMKDPPREPLDEESRHALFEALGRLEDEPRGLLVDHYFEGDTLESLGSREGVSPQAVSKRLERAREDLKRALPAGCLVDLDLMSHFPPAPAVPDLVTGAVLSTVTATAVDLTAGGIAVGSKSTSFLVAMTALFILISSAVVGYLILSRPDRIQTHASAGPVRPKEPALPSAAKTASLSNSEGNTNESPGTDVAPLSSLAVRLNRYKVWIKAWLDERKKLGDDAGVDPRVRDHHGKKLKELPEELEGIRDLIAEDVVTFLAFLKAPENEAYVEDLLLFAFECMDPTARVHWYSFDSLSPELVDGLFSLLSGGTGVQKAAVLEFLAYAKKLPAEREAAWSAHLADPSPQVAAATVRLIFRHSPQSDDLFQQVRQMGLSNSHRDVKREVGLVMVGSPRPEAHEYLFQSLEAARSPEEIQDGALALVNRLDYRRKQSVPLDKVRLNAAVVAALERRPGDPALRWLAWLSLSCPLEQTRAALERIREATSNAGLETAVGTILRRMDEGDRRTHEFIDVISKVPP